MKVAALDDYLHMARKSADWAELESLADVTIFHDHIDPLENLDLLVARLEPFDAIILMRERTAMRRELLERLPNLKLLVSAGARNGAIDYDAVHDRGIMICGTLGDPTMVSEIACGLILAVTRNIPAEDQSIRTGKWQNKVGFSLFNKKLGVLGLGRIGRRVARFGKVFDMDVVAWSHNLTEERCADEEIRLAPSLKTLLAEADVVCVCLVHSDRTDNLVGAREVALMKPGSYMINVSRSQIVDEDALIDAVREERLAGIGLDVFNTEPLPIDHPLRSLPNSVVTPHIGGFTDDTYRNFYTQCVVTVVAWAKGKPINVMSGEVKTYDDLSALSERGELKSK